MNEELKVIISAEIRKLKKGMEDAKKEASDFKNEYQKATENVDKNFKNLGKNISNTFKKVAKSSAVIYSAIGGIGIASIHGYSELEQLSGGVEKLFGTSANTVKKYANDAFRNIGITANEYMDTITSFSAGLITSMGGDTAKASEVANMAITDMADNASIFGTSLDEIQNAYKGFAKQNYTMLDNLKLGFGGTKEEMERLLEEAEKISGIEYNIDSLEDVYNAIHVVQKEMKITGNAAAEASKTIDGSMKAAKSSWSNLITGMADENANIPELVANVVSSSSQVIENIIPIVKTMLSNIPAAISEISPEAGKAFQTIVDIAKPIFEALKTVLKETFEFLKDIINFISEYSTAFTVMAGAVAVLTTAIGLYNIQQGISNALISAKTALNLAETASLWALIKATLAQAAAMITAIAPYVLIVAAIGAVIAIIVVCIKHWDDIKAKVSEVWKSIKEKVSNGVESVKEKFSDLKEGITEKVSNIKENVVNKFNDIKNGIKEKIEGAKEIVHNAIEKIKSFFKFEWSLPKLKMPHISISGEFSLLPPKVPSFGIDWYATGGVFDSPTLFSNGGRLSGLGEAGAEAVVPLENNTEWLSRLADMLNDRMGGRNIVMEVDGKTFAEISVNSINELTRQRGSLPLKLM